ncbi:TIM barrel protein [Clostridium sp. AN503]|uniref:sugar phosphate isomerase/epimerase family protein n=1 Tax=Clostridium sp. AN503 TaxID=3160598 RepID=UPI00345967B1
MMKLCCGSNLYASHSFETALREMAKLDIHHVDIWSCPAICDHANPDRDSVEEIRELLLKYEMTAVSMSLFLMDDKERKKRMEFASRLGIPVVIWEPAQSVDWADNMTNLNPGAVPFGRERGSFEEYMEDLRSQIELAREMGLRVGIEVPHCYTHNEYLFQIYRTDQEIEGDGLSYILAPSHCSARGYEAEDIYRLVSSERVYMLYLWDVKKDFRFPYSDRAFGAGEEQLPGGGRRDFEKQIRNFKEMGYQGWYNISVHGTEGWKDWEKVSEHLKKACELVRLLLDQ